MTATVPAAESLPLPTACLDVDLVPTIAFDASPVLPLDEGGAIVLVRVHGQPLGSVQLEAGETIDRIDLLRRLDRKARAQVTAHLVADGVAVADLRTDEQTIAALEQAAGAACFARRPAPTASSASSCARSARSRCSRTASSA